MLITHDLIYCDSKFRWIYIDTSDITGGVPYCARTKFMIIRVCNEEEEWHEISRCHWRTRAITTLLRFLPDDTDSIGTLLGWWMLVRCTLHTPHVWKMRINKSVARRAICRGLHQFAIKQHRDIVGPFNRQSLNRTYDRLCRLSVCNNVRFSELQLSRLIFQRVILNKFILPAPRHSLTNFYLT